MRAVTWHGKRDVRVDEHPDPGIQDPRDAIIRVTSTAICGSDLHLYEVLTPFLRAGDILGHESMGEVIEVGDLVENLRPGERVVVPFNISCGDCWMCRRELYAQCETTQVREHDKGAALYGYTELYGGVPGAQAELLRVPFADVNPIKVPRDLPDDRYLYLSDVLPTAWQALRFADAEGGSVAVFGLGPIGQAAARLAPHLGIEQVIGVDLVTQRLRDAAAYGAQVVDLRDADDVSDVLRGLTDGRGPDGVVDAVGMESHGAGVSKTMQSIVGWLPDAIGAPLTERAGVDRLPALYTAIDSVRRGGTISVAGVYGGALDPMPVLQLFDKGVQLRMGQCHVRRWIRDLLPLVEADEDPLGLESFATHHLPLDEAPEAYQLFQEEKEQCRKVVLHPAAQAA